MDPAPGGSKDIFFLSLALFGTLWAIFALPFLYHCLRAVRAGEAWLPFEPKPGGGYTFMARNRWFAAFRAPTPERRSTKGLVFRYGVWLWVVVALAYVPVTNLAYILSH
jgi:hypothetical protein